MPTKPKTIKTHALDRILRSALPFAHNDDWLPTINCVSLEAGGGHLIAAATNRFVLGACRTDWPGVQFDCTIPLNKVKLILQLTGQILKPRNVRYERNVGIEYFPGDDVLALSFSRGESLSFMLHPDRKPPKQRRGQGGRFLPKPPRDGFPSWRQLIPEAGTAPTEAFAVNPEYMARFAKVGKLLYNPHMVVMQTAPNKLIVVRIGEDFVGGIMPIRHPSAKVGESTPPAWERPGWLGPLPELKKTG